MKTRILILILTFPTLILGQTLLNAPHFNGRIDNIIEKSYGRSVFILKKSLYFPNIYSGWKSCYFFDKNSNLVRQVNKYKGEIRLDEKIERDTFEHKMVERKIQQGAVNGAKGNYIEQEYILDKEGKIKQINKWSFSAKDKTKEIFDIERNIQYQQKQILSSTSESINYQGDTVKHFSYKFQYDTLGRLILIERCGDIRNTQWEKRDNLILGASVIERQDTLSKLQQRNTLHYNSNGQTFYYKTEYVGELYENQPIKSLTTYFKYDENGNWIKRYIQFNHGKKRLEAKRVITYK